MPEASAVHATIEQYLARFSAGDKAGWLDLFADDATVEDPVGSPVRRGRDEIAAFWDESHGGVDAVELRPVGIAVVCGSEASFAFEVRPTLAGQTYAMHVIDVMTFDDDARVTSQRAFVDFTALRPA